MSSRRPREDPRLIIAIATAIVALALWHLASRVQIHPGPVRHLLVRTIPFALGATAIALAPAIRRILATRRTLALRRAIAVVPPDGFDPRPESVAALAAALARTGGRIGGWADRPASAVRVRLTNDARGRLVYLLEVPARDLARLRVALRPYRGIQVRDAEEVLGGEDGMSPTVGGARTVRAEMVLAGPDCEPLARPALDPDPLAPFAAALAGIRRDRGEVAEVCLDLLPVGRFRAARLRRRMRRQARSRRRDTSPSLAELAGVRETGARDPVELLDRRLLGRAIEPKLRPGAILFEAQILIAARAPEVAGAKATLAGIRDAFASTADRNHLRVRGFPLAGLWFLGSDLPLLRRRFDRRLATGLFRPARRSVLTVAEIAGFLKPPGGSCAVEEVLRCGAALSSPPPLPTFSPDRDDLLPLGRVGGEGGGRLVGVRTEESFFTYVAGRSRYGKTETAIAMFTHLVRAGHGGIFLDPHGDALDRIRPYLTDPEIARRVVEIDLGPGGPESQPAWNLFGMQGVDPEARVDAIVAAFVAAVGWGEQSTRAINLTGQAVAALARVAAVVPPEIAPTIFQLPTLLTDESWRAAVVPVLPTHARAFWTDRFPLLSPDAVTPVTNLVDRLRTSRSTTALFGRSVGTFSIREAMDDGLIVLACPGSGGPRERLVAGLLAFDLLHAARSRAALDPGKRKRFVAVFDEVQSYDGESLAALLEQSAKFGLRAIFLNQDPERLRPATLQALTTNRSHLLASALNSRAAGLVARELGGGVEPAALTRLRRFEFVAQVTEGKELSAPFALRGVRVEDALGEGSEDGLADLRAAVGRSGRARSASEALAHQETLDARILTALEGAARTGDEAGGAKGPMRFGSPR